MFLLEKLILQRIKLNNLSKRKKERSYGSDLLLTNLKISYYWVADRHFIDKRKVILDLPSCAIKKEVNHASNAEQPIYLLK